MILRFNNETLINVSITILDDAIVEPVEYFTVSVFQGENVFPITEAVVAIIDDDGMHNLCMKAFFNLLLVLTVGFSKEEFPYKDCKVTVEIVTFSGVLQNGAIAYVGLVTRVDGGTCICSVVIHLPYFSIFLGKNSTLINIEFTSVYRDHSVTVDICPLAGITDDSNIIAWLSVNIVDNSNINIAIESNMAKLIPASAEPLTVTQQQSSCPAVTIIRDNNVINPDRIIGDGQVAIASSSLYGTIAAIVIAFIILLLVSIVVCYTSYRCGMSKGKRLEEEYYEHAYDCKSNTSLYKNEAYEYTRYGDSEQKPESRPI